MAKAVAVLDTQDNVTARTRLLPVSIAHAVIAKLSDEPSRVHPDDAASFVDLLLGCYPQRKVEDPDVYLPALAAVFTNYPPSVCQKVVNPVGGLASKVAFLPNVKQLTDALNDALAKRNLIIANARSHLDEHQRRLTRRDEPWEAQTPEQKARVRDGLKRLADDLKRLNGMA